MAVKDIIEKADSALSSFYLKLFKKTDIEKILSDICVVLDPQDQEILVVCGKKCEIIFASEVAKTRKYYDTSPVSRCLTGYSRNFPGMCNHCPFGAGGNDVGEEPCEIEDTEGRAFVFRHNIIHWIDGHPAVILRLRDVTPEKETRERLYNLAYIDQLTGVPNRQKLREDFAEIEEGLAENAYTGIIAIFDLDHFKLINDTYGHNTGDVVLRRLTEHFQEDSAFSGHLYRLGGDEFVLFYYEPVDTFGSFDEMKKHYDDILSTALFAYTLPNIDVKCTLSIGVSFFPKHGANLSEILRKADIALYRAKTDGRNRMVFFEERYDTAQKFKDLYISIQPVLLGSGKTFGYELVDCGSGSEEDEKTVSLSEFNRTMDALGLNDIENNSYYFITYSKQLMNPTVLNHLPKEKFVVLMNTQDDATGNDIDKELQVFSELRKNGYKLALNGLRNAERFPELVNLADYCKLSVADKNPLGQKSLISLNQRVRFIATNVDTPQDYQAAKDIGFHMYQGFYFHRPEVVERRTKEISPLKANYFNLLKLSSTEDYMDFHEISSVISSDVALSYKLLRILNSAAVGLRNVTSITGAIAYIGEASLKKWIAVLALRGIADEQPLELIRMSLVRARFGELLAPYFLTRHNPRQVFMVGLLSLLHIALEETREQLLEEIPVADKIRDSLLTQNGVYSELLSFYENYEYANWEAVAQFVEENRLNPQIVNDSYLAAIKWFNDLVGT